MAISSLSVEKHVLAGLIKHPQTLLDMAPFVKDIDFFDEIHSTIFLVIKSLAEKGERWDKVLLAEKIKNIGVSFKDDVNIYDYIDNLSFIPITPQATMDSARELVKIRIRRDLATTANEIITFVNANGNLSLEEIVAGVDAIYGKKTNIIEQDAQPQNLYEGVEEMVENRGNNPVDETGLKTPYPEFNRLYGGLKSKHVYAFASRPGQGKSTLLEDLAIKTAEINDTKAFICDTEMTTEDIRWRAVSARSSVGQWYVETGNFRKNQEMTEKVRATYPKIREFKDKKYVTHYHVGDKNLDQVISMIRRWHAANIKQGQKGIIVYDYLKLTSSNNVSDNWREHQAMGQMINRLKRIAEELDCVSLTAIQLNRTGENFNRKSSDVVDDSSAIAISDRLQWFAAFVAIFRRKTLDEMNRDGQRFGSHKMIPIKTRFQGRDAAGHHNLFRRMGDDGELKWENNFLNFAVSNFDVTEVGSLRDIIESERMQATPDDQNLNDGGAL